MEEQIQKIGVWLGTGSINIFGRPFAGKDTQCRQLAELFEGEIIAGGDILRSHPDQQMVKQLMETGNLFPTDIYMNIVLPYFSQSELHTKPLILSSVGRMHGEEPTITKAADDSGHPLKAVVLLTMSEAEVNRRFNAYEHQVHRGERLDDHHEVLPNRLKEFRDKTIPVIEYYRALNLVLEIDGTQPPDAVTAEILKKLSKLADQ